MSEPPQSPRKRSIWPQRRREDPIDWVHLTALVVAGGCVAGVFTLIGCGHMSANEGLPWIAATLGGLQAMRNGRKSR